MGKNTSQMTLNQVRHDGEEHTALQAISSNLIYPNDVSISTNGGTISPNDNTISTNDQRISTNECTI
jgi:hypothetical protein